MTRKIPIKGYKVSKDGRRLEPCFKHLPVNIQLQKCGSKRIRAGKRALASLQRP